MEQGEKLIRANIIFMLLKCFQLCFQVMLLVLTAMYMKNSHTFILYLMADISLLVWNSLSTIHYFYDKRNRKEKD
ncbi:hypothetical protein Avbf_12267 [Armadillidium vulgare]|nr:hypothetical protein Avbf_12267 [Armadillidium vulgare]